MDNLIRDKIKTLVPYKVNKKEYKWRLNANESPLDQFDDWQEEIMAELKREGLNLYPDPTSDELRDLLSTYTGYDPENMLCGNGSDELIKMIVEVFLDQGDKVVVHTPTFSEYMLATDVAGGDVVEVESDSVFNVDIDAIIKAVNDNKAKVVFLCMPNNPTGNVFEKTDILRVFKETEAIVVSDEAYFEFCGVTLADEAVKNDRLVVLRTLSKAFGLAGLRVGYAIGTPYMMDLLGRVKMPYNVNSFSQAVARVALKNRSQVQSIIDTLISERERMFSALNGLPNLEIIPSKANFLLYRSPKADELVQTFEENGIGIRAFGNKKRLEQCFRINIGVKEANDEIIQLFKDVLINE